LHTKLFLQQQQQKQKQQQQQQQQQQSGNGGGVPDVCTLYIPTHTSMLPN